MICTLHFFYRMSNNFYSTKLLYIHHGLLLQQHFCSHLSFPSSTKNEYIFGFNPMNYLTVAPPVSCFTLSTTNFSELSQYFDSAEQLLKSNSE